MMKRTLVGVLVITTLACGGSSPTSPLDNSVPGVRLAPYDLTGTWVGTMTDIALGPRAGEGTLRATVTQSPDLSPGLWFASKSYHFTGSWSATFPDPSVNEHGTWFGEMLLDGSFASEFAPTGDACHFTLAYGENGTPTGTVRVVNNVITGEYYRVFVSTPPPCLGSRGGSIRLTRQ